VTSLSKSSGARSGWHGHIGVADAEPSGEAHEGRSGYRPNRRSTFDERLSAQAEVVSDVAEDAGQGTDSEAA
jgi:hypothetical protein